MKKTIALASVLATVSATALGASAVFAAGHGANTQQRMSGLVNALAEKFHVAPADVQAVVDAQHAQTEAQMHQQLMDRIAASLTQAVKDGKITQAQSDLITAKIAEVKALETSLQGKTPAERQAAMKTEMTNLLQWAKDNNLPTQYLMSFGRGGVRGGMGMGMHDPKAMLDQAVKDGKLTQAQEDLIIAKQAEVKTFTDTLKDKNQADRQTAMQTEMTAVKAWATTNNIPEQYILPFGGGMMHGGGMRGGMGHGMRGGHR